MHPFTSFFLMTPEDAKRYAVEVLDFFRPGEDLDCTEIGDGNINYVFKVWSRERARSVVIKQADRLLRSSGRPLDMVRSKLEAQLLQLEGELAPGFVPEVYRYDEVMAALSMEDISAYGNLRKELAAGRVYGHLAENLSAFLARTLLPTTDLVMDRQEKKRRAQFFTNPELCDITELLVLTEPYWDFRSTNVIAPGNEDFVKRHLYEDQELHAQVGWLRDRFMNCAQALLHGDLHSGSVFANDSGIKVIDPEFAFYGPMGYDIGNVIGNLFFAWANRAVTAPEDGETAAALERTIRDTVDLTRRKLEETYDSLVQFPFYRTEAFRRDYLDGVMADAFGYAGTEIIRRTVGSSKVAEITSVTDPVLRPALERYLIKLGILLIKERTRLHGGRQVTDAFRLILA